uniref:CCHC-type domain-containing protein n=1 Tax=Cacopsylla melanoneura TaxID=428564 RepID=A0A8D8VQB1_9HEMI
MSTGFRALSYMTSSWKWRAMKALKKLSATKNSVAVELRPKVRVLRNYPSKRDGSGGKNWVLELEPSILKALNASKKLYIGWQSCRFADYCKIAICLKCLGYGHLAKDCTLAARCGLRNYSESRTLGMALSK